MSKCSKDESEEVDEDTINAIRLATEKAAKDVRNLMKNVDSILAEPKAEEKYPENRPPQGLSPEEEVAWWNSRIEELSRPVASDRNGESKCKDSEDKYAAKRSEK